MVAEFQQCDDSPTGRVDPHQISRLELGFPEEGLGPLGLEVDQSAQDDAGGCRRHRPEGFELGFTVVAGQELDDRPQVLQIE